MYRDAFLHYINHLLNLDENNLIPKIMWSDPDFILLSKFFITNLQLVPNILKENKSFILRCIKKCPDILWYASERLKHDYDVVLLAVKYNGTTLRYASSEYRANKYIVLTAIKHNPSAILYADETIRVDPEFKFINLKSVQEKITLF